jgi:hypothetical protein
VGLDTVDIRSLLMVPGYPSIYSMLFSVGYDDSDGAVHRCCRRLHLSLHQLCSSGLRQEGEQGVLQKCLHKNVLF